MPDTQNDNNLCYCFNKFIKRANRTANNQQLIGLMLLSQQTSPRIRLINLFVPPSVDPLLTTYRKQLNPKILPMKRSLSILSNLKQYPTVKQQKTQLTDQDYVKVNRSYNSLKKFKKSYFIDCEKYPSEEDCEKDPQYLRLVQIRRSMLRKRQADQKKMCHSLTTGNLKGKDPNYMAIATESCEDQSGMYIKIKPMIQSRQNISKQEKQTKELQIQQAIEKILTRNYKRA